MTVYVDGAVNSFRRMKMCHMVADTPDELHNMAAKIGMRRNWYQDPMSPRVSFPHYDVCRTRRALAVKLGAQQVSRHELAAFMKRIRAPLLAAQQTWAQAGWSA